MQEVNKDLWTKASLVAKGIRRLIWTYTDFYIFNHDISEELDVYNVYLNDYGRFSVKLDNGSEFFLVQPCPHLIYELYEKAHFNLKKEGRLFIVIQTKHGAKSHYTKLTTIFQTVNLLAKINSHWLIEAVK